MPCTLGESDIIPGGGALRIPTGVNDSASADICDADIRLSTERGSAGGGRAGGSVPRDAKFNDFEASKRFSIFQSISLIKF